MLRVIVDPSVRKACLDIFVVDIGEDGFVKEYAKPCELVMEKLAHDAEVPATFSFPLHRGYDFLREFAQAMAEIHLREAPSNRDGEIKRLEDHLGDLRKLVFKEKANGKAGNTNRS